MEASGTTVHLRRSDGDADIHSLEDGVLSLPTQEVAIDVQTIDEEATPKTHVNGEYIPEWKRAVPLTEKRLTITVEPRVKVRNYGRLSIEV